jgi:hypothetical protein
VPDRMDITLRLWGSIFAPVHRAQRVVATSPAGVLLSHALRDAWAIDRGHVSCKVDAIAIADDDDPLLMPGSVVDFASRPASGVDVVLAAVALIASFAASQLAQRFAPTVSSRDGEETRYGFDVLGNDAFEGDVEPVVLGEVVKYPGKVIGRVPGLASDGSGNDVLKLLVHLSASRCKSICGQPNDFDNIAASGLIGATINDQPITNYANVRAWGRMGRPGQRAMPGFDDTELTREVGAGGVQLPNTSGSDRAGTSASGEAFALTTINAVNAVVIRVRLSEGLYAVADGAQVEPATVRWRYRWRAVGGGYGDWTVVAVTQARQSPFWSAPRVEIGATAQQVEIQVERVSREPADLTVRDGLLWGNLVEVTDAENDYAGSCVLGLEIPAGVQVQAEPRLAFTVEGFDDCALWDGISPASAPVFTQGFSRNPAALALAYVTNEEWGMGARYTIANVDLPSLFACWPTCEEPVEIPEFESQPARTRPRYAVDLVLAERRPASEHLRDICAPMRVRPVLVGSKWYFIQDRVQETPAEVFTDGDILVEGGGGGKPAITVTRELTTRGWNRPNQVVVQFEDRLEQGRLNTYTYPPDGQLWLGGPEPETPVVRSIRLPGQWDADQAAVQAIHEMNKLRYQRWGVTLRSRVAFPAVRINERFDVATSLMDWGFASGSILRNSTVAGVVLDRTITILAGVTYALKIIHLDNTIERRSLDLTPGTYLRGSAIPPASSFAAAPQFGATWVLEELTDGVAAKPFLCTSIALVDFASHIWEITGVEYEPGVYNTTPGEVIQREYSGLASVFSAPGPLESLRVLERIDPQTNEVRAELAWTQRPEDRANTFMFRVYRRYSGTSFWVFVPEAYVSDRSAMVDIVNLSRGYEFRVVAVSAVGSALDVNDPRHPIATLALGLSDDPPPPPTNLTLTRTAGNGYTLSWDAVDDAVGYIVYSGRSPAGGVFADCRDCFVLTRTNATQITDLRLPTGTSTFYVRSVGGNGRMSRGQVNVSVTNTFAPAGQSLKHTFTANLAAGTQTNMTLASGVYIPTAPGSPAVWESPEVDTGSDTAMQFAYSLQSRNRAEDPTLATFPHVVPSIEADQWGIASVGPKRVEMIFPPYPDASHEWIVEVAIKIGSVYGAWQRVLPYALFTATARYYKVRVTWRRTIFPYRSGVAGLTMVTFA